MTDNLRDRIAAVLKTASERRGIYRIADFDYPFLADAVIEALDLGIPCASDGCRMRQIARRSAEKLGLTGDGE